VKIIPTSVVKEGGERYEPGTEYDVDDEAGRRFVILGWATSPQYTPAGVEPPPPVADVDVHSVTNTSATTEV
jgi:hypothetical protein